MTTDKGSIDDLAVDERDDLIEGAVGPVEPRRLPQVVSLRLDPELLASLRDIAKTRGATISDLLREGAIRVVEESVGRMNVGAFLNVKVSTAIQTQVFDNSTPAPSAAGLNAYKSVLSYAGYRTQD